MHNDGRGCVERDGMGDTGRASAGMAERARSASSPKVIATLFMLLLSMMVPVSLPATAAEGDLPLPPTGHEAKVRPEKVELYQLDESPLGDRRPLLLIHGGNGDVSHLFRWDKMLHHFAKDDAFGSTFKVYLLRYNSNDLLENIVPQTVEVLTGLQKQTGKRISIMALSMGGNVAQLSMAKPEVDQAVDFVITLATPFHGSPLFSADWFEYSLYKSRMMPMLRVLDNIDYRAYFGLHKNYQQDLKWDDSDDMIPQVGYFKSKLPFGPKGYLTQYRDSVSFLEKENRTDDINKQKFITYAAYLLNPYVLTETHHKWEHALLASYRFVSTQIKAQLGKEQAALMVLNRQISKVDAGPGAGLLGAGAHVYALNDGITPVSSATYLSPRVCRTLLLLHETDVPRLKGFIDVKKARVFRNIDHVTFVEGKPPHGGSRKVLDQLHADEEPREIFDWMLAELMEAASEKSLGADGGT